ncbi:UDP-glucose/GDP-mannose dehydrogenase family protein [Cloacibacillus porcorum]|uniref:UDP-glucose dehydrogenase family protein n=1 Tax=Cloacibacillus porcorum TaxID=1197717 RepID=UPI0014592E6F|nr:UDP-glucose/GDP-mannose dehydrogenase family protein [Cloacibacillus porcorum]MCC8184822.1 UDP-glucose/GDP-mannose dehydrogenase family protein [Cloacibacillus porcorum]MDY5389411.1 UDP-glucose/GDP-mannose dehydrogenase family protein [Cloacibacillus porcorum]NMF19020.1 UDP-glucose/GDP-mannose dehydrogenase family protein [Cloacibacillus porcorum]
MKICVVGTGYVGLVTGTCFAEKGHTVCCIDIDEERIGKLKKGISPIYEPGLDELIKRNQLEGRLSFSTKIRDGLEGTQLCFIAVGTPPADDGRADLAQVLAAIDDIGSELSHSCYIVVKSTVPVGTGTLLCKRIKNHLRERGMEKINLEILSNPEFLKEGMAIEDCLHPDRVVVGAASDEARAVMRELYRPFVSEEKIIFMDPASAEITKYAANTMLAARISFMNEIAQLCDKVGADVLSVKKGMASDRRIGEYFLNAGCGYGGSCFPKDVQALCYIGEGQGLDMTMASAVSKVNRKQKEQLQIMMRERFGEDMEEIEAAIMGLAFKPHTNDMREAPSITLIRGLLNCGASVRAYDPIAMDEAHRLLPDNVQYAADIESLLAGADCAVIVTEWPQFKEADWKKLGGLMKRKIVFDGRNICDPEKMRALGFEYYCIGRNMRPR